MFYVPDTRFLDKITSLSQMKANDYIEIIIVIFALYYIISKVRGTRVWILTKGCIFMLLLYQAAYAMSFGVITYIAQGIFTFAAIALVIMFQPELRKLLESLGKKGFTLKGLFHAIKGKDGREASCSKESIHELVKAADIMSKAKTGALILIERTSDLGRYEESGIPLHADITSQLIVNAFEKNTPLHDGAMIIKDNKITAATCYLPLSDNRDIDKDLGTRHRAAVGASEETDALVIVVSEETGAVSVADHGAIRHGISMEELRETLIDSQEKNGLFKETNEKKFWSNIKSFILSAVLGITAWIFIGAIVDPSVTRTFSGIPVEIVNDRGIADAGYVYEVKSGDTVSIDATGKKSVINQLSASSFKASADAGEMSISNSMNINVSAVKYDNDIKINTHNAMLTISVDEAVSIDCPVTAESTGYTAEGYYVADLLPETGTVTVTGAKSKLQTIDHASAVVDISQADSDFETKSPLILYDKNGSRFDDSLCTISMPEVKVAGKVYRTKSIPVEITAYDSSFENCSVNIKSIESGKTEVIVAGSRKMLDKIKKAEISIDVAGTGSRVSISVDPANYLPEGIYYTEKKNMDITMEIVRVSRKSFAVAAEDIEIKNGKGKIKDKYCSIQVKCSPDEEYSDMLKKLKPYVDLHDLKKGKHKVPLKFGSGMMETVKNAWVIVKVT